MGTSLCVTSLPWSKNRPSSYIRYIPRQDTEYACPGASIRAPGPSIPCSSRNLLSQGTRSPQLPKEGDGSRCQHTEEHYDTRQPISPTSPSVSQKAQGRRRQSSMTGDCMDHSHRDLDRGVSGLEFKNGTPQDDRSLVNKSDSHTEKSTAVDFETELSHPKWCGMLTAMVSEHVPLLPITCRRLFACYVRSTTTSATTLYPITLPHLGVFGRMSPSMSVRERRAVNLKRVTYIIIYALNYWYYNGPPPDIQFLGRAPSSAHRRIHRRVESFVKSDQGMASFRVAKAGRRFPQLIARIGELSETMTRCGLGGDQYSKAFQGFEQKDGLDVPELCPYRDLKQTDYFYTVRPIGTSPTISVTSW